MNRPLRHEFPGALYHITARGNRRATIFRSDSDRLVWLALLAETCARFKFVVHAYCQMGNHYHLVLTTLDGGLGEGMRYLNARYSQYFNRRHGLVGHVFQGRYKAVICQRESYLMALVRYVVLNPVRARMVSEPGAWPWSSFAAMVGQADAPPWLDVPQVLALFGSERQAARQEFVRFVLQGIGAASPLSKVSCQFLLGDEGFCKSLAGKPINGNAIEVKRVRRRATVQPLEDYFPRWRGAKESMALAYLSRGYSMAEIARYCGVSVKTVSRAVKTHEEKNQRIEPDQTS